MDQGSNKNHSPAYNFTPTVTKFCVMWEGLSLPHDTKFGNCRCKIVDSRSFHSWSLIHGLRWSGLIKVGPGVSEWLCRLDNHTHLIVTPMQWVLVYINIHGMSQAKSTSVKWYIVDGVTTTSCSNIRRNHQMYNFTGEVQYTQNISQYSYGLIFYNTFLQYRCIRQWTRQVLLSIKHWFNLGHLFT